MPSLIQGFEYDIFISYRQNDNLDGWVTDFVQNLEKELRSTLKDIVTIYFDKNPHDGLLETHNVDKSLEGKLKCLIFIPIISQTYCDTKSFAWQHEFCAFNKLTKEDLLGRDIRLSNGNVASRILPIKIHDLDTTDKEQLETELGGVLRAIEFIYKEAGVNRPLQSNEENPGKNQNQTTYRNQVNKVANAIKEIIISLRSPVRKPFSERERPMADAGRISRALPLAIAALLLIFAAYFIYPRIFPSEKKEEVIRKSIAVLAFTDMSPNHDQDWFADGISEEIIDRLTRVPELKVIARTSSFYYKGKNAKIDEIGRTLGVNHILEGSVRKIGDQLKITVQLIRITDDSHLWSEVFERSADKLFDVQAEIAETVATKILQVDSKKITIADERPISVECYEYYLRAMKIVQKGNNSNEAKEAEELLLQAIKLDPSFASAYMALADLYNTWGNYPGGGITRNEIRAKYHGLEDSLSQIAWRINPNSAYVLKGHSGSFFKTQNYDSGFYYMKKAYRADPNSSYLARLLGSKLYHMGLSDQGREFFMKSLEADPLALVSKRVLATEQMLLGNFDNAEIGLKEVLDLDTTSELSHRSMAFIYIHRKDFANAEREIRVCQKMQGDKRQLLLEALLLARKGRKSEALQLISISEDKPGIAFYSVLGMKKETLHVLDSLTTSLLKGQIYGSASLSSFVSLHGLDNSTFYDFIRAEPKFKEIREKVKKDHDEKLSAYRKYF
ncbi:MAG: hypothetical protein AABY93_16785 [Bacteroidota bacterium]